MVTLSTALSRDASTCGCGRPSLGLRHLRHVQRVECRLVDELEHAHRLAVDVHVRHYRVALLAGASRSGPHAAPLLDVGIWDLDLCLRLQVVELHNASLREIELNSTTRLG